MRAGRGVRRIVGVRDPGYAGLGWRGNEGIAAGMAKKKDKSPAPKIVNRKARHDYELLEKLEVGIALQGSEVKAIRDGRVSLGEGYVTAESTPRLALTVHNIDIGEYAPAASTQHRPKRTRTLLAHKKEIERLATAVQAKGLTIVPLEMYFSGRGQVKLLIALAKGRGHADKREAIAKRDMERDLRRAMSKRV